MTTTVAESSFALTVVFDKISTLPRGDGTSVDSDRVMVQHGTSFYLQMFIDGNTAEQKYHCSLYLISTDAVKLSFSMKLVNHIDDKKSINKPVIPYEFEADDGFGWPTFIKSEKLLDPKHGFLMQDAISIVLQMKIEGKQKLYDYRNCIVGDMTALLFDESTTDYFIIIPGDNDKSISSPSAPSTRKHNLETSMMDTSSRIPVHKFVLQSRSKVFKAVLLSTMKESTSMEIIISDFDHDVVKEFIRFLYLDKCDKEILDKHAKSLLAMAHKYEVNKLFEICDSFLLGILNVDNVVDFLQLGDLYGAMELKREALKLVKKEFKVLLLKSGRFYESLNSDLMHEVICRLVDA